MPKASIDGSGNLAAEQIPSTTGSRQAAIPVLDNTADNAAPTSIIPNIKLFSPVPEILTIEAPILCKTCIKHRSTNNEHTCKKYYGRIREAGKYLFSRR